MKVKKSYLPIFLLLSISIVPVIVGALLYYFSNSFSLKTMSHGTLIKPPILIELKTGNQNKWQVLYIHDAYCDSDCQSIAYMLHQVQKVLGKDYERVTIIDTDEKHTQLKSVLTQQGQKDFDIDNKIYLIDPRGYLFMYYPSTTDPMNVLKDLQRVLEVSQIG